MATGGFRYAASALAAAAFFVACAPEAPRQPRLAPSPTPYVLAVMAQQDLVDKFVNDFPARLQEYVKPVLFSSERLNREQTRILNAADKSAAKSIDEFIATEEKEAEYRRETGIVRGYLNDYTFSVGFPSTAPDDISTDFGWMYNRLGELRAFRFNVSLQYNLNERGKVMPAGLAGFVGETKSWQRGIITWVRTDLSYNGMAELPAALFRDIPGDLVWETRDTQLNPDEPLHRVMTARFDVQGWKAVVRMESTGKIQYSAYKP